MSTTTVVLQQQRERGNRPTFERQISKAIMSPRRKAMLEAQASVRRLSLQSSMRRASISLSDYEASSGSMSFKGNVQFATENTFHYIETLDEVTDEEVLATWFTYEECRELKNDAYRAVAALEAGHDDVDERGLELHTQLGAWNAYKAKQDMYNAVLGEQDKQARARKQDWDEIARLYRNETEKCIEEAVARGKKDEEEAQAIYLRKTASTQKEAICRKSSSSIPSLASSSVSDDSGYLDLNDDDKEQVVPEPHEEKKKKKKVIRKVIKIKMKSTCPTTAKEEEETDVDEDDDDDDDGDDGVSLQYLNCANKPVVGRPLLKDFNSFDSMRSLGSDSSKHSEKSFFEEDSDISLGDYLASDSEKFAASDDSFLVLSSTKKKKKKERSSSLSSKGKKSRHSQHRKTLSCCDPMLETEAVGNDSLSVAKDKQAMDTNRRDSLSSGKEVPTADTELRNSALSETGKTKNDTVSSPVTKDKHEADKKRRDSLSVEKEAPLSETERRDSLSSKKKKPKNDTASQGSSSLLAAKAPETNKKEKAKRRDSAKKKTKKKKDEKTANKKDEEESIGKAALGNLTKAAKKKNKETSTGRTALGSPTSKSVHKKEKVVGTDKPTLGYSPKVTEQEDEEASIGKVALNDLTFSVHLAKRRAKNREAALLARLKRLQVSNGVLSPSMNERASAAAADYYDDDDDDNDDSIASLSPSKRLLINTISPQSPDALRIDLDALDSASPTTKQKPSKASKELQRQARSLFSGLR